MIVQSKSTNIHLEDLGFVFSDFDKLCILCRNLTTQSLQRGLLRLREHKSWFTSSAKARWDAHSNDSAPESNPPYFIG